MATPTPSVNSSKVPRSAIAIPSSRLRSSFLPNGQLRKSHEKLRPRYAAVPAQHNPPTSTSNMREVATQRLACDRCHGQKLRCSRSSQAAANGACQRCIKAKAHCQYSSPLRLGRPANKPPDLAKQGRRRSSNALPSPYESVSDASERQLEESYVNGLPQLDYPSVHEAEAPPLQEGHSKFQPSWWNQHFLMPFARLRLEPFPLEVFPLG